MPDEQSTTQHSDAVPPGWQALPRHTTAAPNLFPGRAGHGIRLSLWGLITTWVVLAVGVVLFIAALAGWDQRKFAMNTNLTESSSAPLTETPEEISRRRFFLKNSLSRS